MVRILRGVYRTGAVPRSTQWWMQRRLALLDLDVVAPTLAELEHGAPPGRTARDPAPQRISYLADLADLAALECK